MVKASPKKSARAIRQQFGVLPYRQTKKAGLEIMLITSRETRRWIVPKGWPIKGLKPSESAAQEAYEEAGLHGTTAKRALGCYVYEKRMAEKRTTVPCEVKVYAMRVSRQDAVWPEQSERETCWFSQADAAEAVSEPELKTLITDFVRPRLEKKSSRNPSKISKPKRKQRATSSTPA